MKQNKETLKEHFETGDKPTQEQYADLIDSYVDSKQPEGEANRRFVINETGEVGVVSEAIAPVYTLSDIVANKLSFLKDGEIVKEIDLTTYVDDTNLARLVNGVYNATTKLATFTRDDGTTFDLDLSSLELGLTFTDEDGNVKYSSSTDKRTGYYDVYNEIYYPNISYTTEGIFNWFNISHDEKLRVLQTGTYGGVNFEWASGIVFDVSNSFIEKVRISVELNIFSRTNQHFHKILISGTMNVSLGVFTWDNQKASIIGGEISSDQLVNVFFGKIENKPFIGASIRGGLNSYLPADLTFSNMSVDMKTGTAAYKISEFYKGIEKKPNVNSYFSTETSTPSIFLEIDTKIDYNDMLPIGKILAEDASMDPSFDKNLVYDPIDKKYGFIPRADGIKSIVQGTNISIDSTDPHNLIISANTDGSMILKTPDGTKDYRISLDNLGNIVTTQVI